MNATTDKLVERYLKHLEIELDDLPRDRRREIVDEIAGHIAEARAGLEHETEADARNILEGVGDPADIAADARERFEVKASSPQSNGGWKEVVALVLLLVGGVILPVVGWIVGVVLLWVSNAWNVRDKIIGTLLVPGGLLLPLGFTVVAGSAGGCDVPVGQPANCPGGGSSAFWTFVPVALFVLIPITTTVYLALRLRATSVAAAY